MAPHSLPDNAPTSAQEHPAAPPNSVQHVAQGSASGASSSPQAAPSSPVTCDRQAAAVAQKATQPSAETRPAGEAQPSGLATTLTGASPHTENDLSRSPAAMHRTNSSVGNNGQISVEQNQAQGDSAGVSNTASTQQQSRGGVQQEQQAGADTEGGSPSCSPQPGGQGSAGGWKPSPPAELPVRSITQVACLGLVSEFLHDIGQVTTTAVSLGRMLVALWQHSPRLYA